MEPQLIYKKSEALQSKIDWITPTDSEWSYCGTKGEIKVDVIENEFIQFFEGNDFFIATTRKASFESTRQTLFDNVANLVGNKNFFVWDEHFQRVIEFSWIGIFRKGIYDINITNPVFKINYNKMAPGSPDKVRGKPVKYKKGDCLSIHCEDGNYLAAFISQKFNKYYDFTLI